MRFVPELNPRSLIDRDDEQELFRQLTSFNTAARMLAISDRGGWGKSSLLRRLLYNCQWELRPPAAACLIQFDDHKDPAPFALVSKIVEELSSVEGQNTRERFAKFNELDNARVFKIAAAFDDGADYRSRGRQITAVSHAGSVGEGGVSAGLHVQHANKIEYSSERSEFTEEQERHARMRCVQAFFDDLRTVCATQPIVLMFDAFEQCNVKLRDWILGEFLRNNVLHPDRNLRPDKLGIVIAGRPYHPSSNPEGLRPDEFRPVFGSQADMEACVLSIASLSKWDPDHISKFLILQGLQDPSQDDIRFIQSKLRQGVSLEKILTIIRPLAVAMSGPI